MAPDVEGRGLEMFGAMGRRWLPATLVGLSLLGGAVAYAESLPAEYDASATVSFAPPPTIQVGGDTIRLAVQAYPSVVTAPETIRAIAGEVGVTTESLTKGVNAEVGAETANLKITVRLRSAKAAATAANRLAETAVDFAATRDRLLDGQVISAAVTPKVPAAPPRRLLEAAAFLAAALAALGTALLLERNNPRVRGMRDVVRLATLPVLARIPRSRAARRDLSQAIGDPSFGVAVRNLRTYLETELRSSPIQTIMVTSSVAGEGKTTLSVALASAVAGLNARVLLIDADMHRGRVAEALGLPGAGIEEALNGSRTLDEAVVPGPVRGLFLLLGVAGAGGGDLLALEMPRLLAEAKGKYDVVLLDGPPILGNDDGATLATQVDGVLLIVRAGSPQGPFAEATAQLESLGVRVLGTVLNRVRPSRTYGSATTYAYGRGQR